MVEELYAELIGYPFLAGGSKAVDQPGLGRYPVKSPLLREVRWYRVHNVLSRTFFYLEGKYGL
ncbi:hypothetical protein BO225_06280 [Dubosiella newyorkensis]|uniref:Uncharacterized protein n=1 Tax=Dubosiella newyorkensis TaxID=1862672 RepID=A0A1U7NMF0_9FIRM|nr:hypothetical protein BO225_06280 [Dubosiella newyorkensis]